MRIGPVKFGFDMFVGIAVGFMLVALFAVQIYDDAWVGVAGFALATIVASIAAGKSSPVARPRAPLPPPTSRGEGDPKPRPPEN